MIIYGVAVLAACSLVGLMFGELLGYLCGVKANVGGVGFSMLLMIAVTPWLKPETKFGETTIKGILFWSAMYVPIVVAMSASQNVIGAIKGGRVALLAGGLAVGIGFGLVALLARITKSDENTIAMGDSEDVS